MFKKKISFSNEPTGLHTNMHSFTHARRAWVCKTGFALPTVPFWPASEALLCLPCLPCLSCRLQLQLQLHCTAPSYEAAICL